MGGTQLHMRHSCCLFKTTHFDWTNKQDFLQSYTLKFLHFKGSHLQGLILHPVWTSWGTRTWRNPHMTNDDSFFLINKMFELLRIFGGLIHAMIMMVLVCSCEVLNKLETDFSWADKPESRYSTYRIGRYMKQPPCLPACLPELAQGQTFSDQKSKAWASFSLKSSSKARTDPHRCF